MSQMCKSARGTEVCPACQVNIKPANQVAPSQISQGSVLQRPSASDATTATATDAAGSSTAAQDILSSLGGGLADSPGVSPAPQGQVARLHHLPILLMMWTFPETIL